MLENETIHCVCISVNEFATTHYQIRANDLRKLPIEPTRGEMIGM